MYGAQVHPSKTCTKQKMSLRHLSHCR